MVKGEAFSSHWCWSASVVDSCQTLEEGGEKHGVSAITVSGSEAALDYVREGASAAQRKLRLIRAPVIFSKRPWSEVLKKKGLMQNVLQSRVQERVRVFVY